MRADEHLKKCKGLPGTTPLVAVSGWKLQHEQSAEKGLTIYFTPINAGSNERRCRLRWRGIRRRSGTIHDLSYNISWANHLSLENPRSMLR